MHDDLRLAVLLLTDTPRATKRFHRRFRDDLDLAYEHCRVAVELGLEFKEYCRGVARSAARSLLSSLPTTSEDAVIDAHVGRVLGHRDFGLALLLRRDVDDAWRAFAQNFGNYLRSLFTRAGMAADLAHDSLLALVEELRQPAPGETEAPIADYRGRTDLNNWLFCYVRRCYKKISPKVESSQTQPSITQALAQIPPHMDRQQFYEVVRDAFLKVWSDLAERDVRLLEVVAHGGSTQALAASGVLIDKGKAPDAAFLMSRHHHLFQTIYDRCLDQVQREFKGKESALVVEEALREVVIHEFANDLAQVVGWYE